MSENCRVDAGLQAIRDACDRLDKARMEEDLLGADLIMESIREWVTELHNIAHPPGEEESYPRPKDGWLCFHCGERFRTPGEARWHFGTTPESKVACLIAGAEARGLTAALRDAEDERDELQAGFDIRWRADMRAIKIWTEEDPSGRDLCWPDHADLCVWLMQRLAEEPDHPFRELAVALADLGRAISGRLAGAVRSIRRKLR